MKEILEILKNMPLEERMDVLNTLREYLRQLEDENPNPIYYHAKLNGQ